MERAPRRQSDWSLSAFVRNPSAAPGTLPGRQTHTGIIPFKKSRLRHTHSRPIIERKQVIVCSGVSLWICFRGQMTSADSCFPVHRKRCNFLAKVVKRKWFVEVFVTFFKTFQNNFCYKFERKSVEVHAAQPKLYFDDCQFILKT